MTEPTFADVFANAALFEVTTIEIRDATVFSTLWEGPPVTNVRLVSYRIEGAEEAETEKGS